MQNNMRINKDKRVLAISLSTRGFGYTVLEGKDRLVDYGNKGSVGKFKNVLLLAAATKIVRRNTPDMLVLRDMTADGKNRSKRVKELHHQLIALTKKHKIKVAKISGKKVRMALLNDEWATKHEMALHLATLFPEELGSRLPPKRKPWAKEHSRMDMFDAVGLAVAFMVSA